MANHIKNNLLKIIKKLNENVKFNSVSIRYLESIVEKICKTYFKIYNSNKDNIKTIKKIYKNEMANNLIKLIINREEIYNNNLNPLYRILMSNLQKNINIKLGKRKRFNDNYTNKKIKKIIINDINSELTSKKINYAKEKLNIIKNTYKFKYWLNKNYPNNDDEILSILSIIIEYSCLEIIDVTINRNKEKETINKDDIIKSIEYDEELKYFINNIC
jgi:hypothetical protein